VDDVMFTPNGPYGDVTLPRQPCLQWIKVSVYCLHTILMKSVA